MDAIDTYIPQPVREIDKPFLMPIEDVFSIEGRGTVVTGRIERGKVKVGEEVEIVGFATRPRRSSPASRCSTRRSTKAGGRQCRRAAARRQERETSSAARCLRSRARITPHTNFEAEVYILTKEEGGRHSPFFTGYKPQFYFRTTDVTGELTLPEGTEMVMPGDTIKIMGELITPVAMDEGLRFAIREGGRTVGAGVVSKILK